MTHGASRALSNAAEARDEAAVHRAVRRRDCDGDSISTLLPVVQCISGRSRNIDASRNPRSVRALIRRADPIFAALTGHMLAALEAGWVTVLLSNPLWVINTRQMTAKPGDVEQGWLGDAITPPTSAHAQRFRGRHPERNIER